MRTSVDVHNWLVERDIPHELVPTRGRLRTPENMAAVLGIPADQAGRVVLLQGRKHLIAVLVPAASRPNLRRVARSAPTPTLVEIPPDRVTDLTEFLDEALPPVGLPTGTQIILDRSLSEQEVLYFPGGETSSLLKIRAPDLIRATAAKVARVAE
jgi:prolyl-tRNA editing enzyme YbaK/EbsC (Cys-tRNA(Pro) deacylase)